MNELGHIIVLADGREVLIPDSLSKSDASAKAVQRKILTKDEFFDIQYIVAQNNNQKITENE